MPRLKRQGSAPGEGFTPLPKGSYTLMIDTVQETQSKEGNDQLRVDGHVTDHPSYTDRKVVRFFSLKETALWKLIGLLDAVGIDYEYQELDGKDAKGNPLCEIDFDTDDLPGCSYVADATIREYNGAEQNDWQRERAVPGSSAATKAAAESAGSNSVSAAGKTAAPAAAAQVPPAAQPARRTSRA